MERRQNQQPGPSRALRLVTIVVTASLFAAGVALVVAAFAARALFGERGGFGGAAVVFTVTVALSVGAGNATTSLIKRRLDR
jgi:hypothetical protein